MKKVILKTLPETMKNGLQRHCLSEFWLNTAGETSVAKRILTEVGYGEGNFGLSLDYISQYFASNNMSSPLVIKSKYFNSNSTICLEYGVYQKANYRKESSPLRS